MNPLKTCQLREGGFLSALIVCSRQNAITEEMAQVPCKQKKHTVFRRHS